MTAFKEFSRPAIDSTEQRQYFTWIWSSTPISTLTYSQWARFISGGTTWCMCRDLSLPTSWSRGRNDQGN